MVPFESLESNLYKEYNDFCVYVTQISKIKLKYTIMPKTPLPLTTMRKYKYEYEFFAYFIKQTCHISEESSHSQEFGYIVYFIVFTTSFERSSKESRNKFDKCGKNKHKRHISTPFNASLR